MLGIVFPGQGSQSVGMGKDLSDSSEAARLVFAEVDDALGVHLSKLIFEGPIEDLTLTSNTQPALMAVSLAALRSLESRGFDITSASFVAGHSLGEYSGLAAVGSLSITDTARLLRLRGEAMQSAVPVGAGAMAAIIGLASDKVESVCLDISTDDSVCEIANDNGGDQWVISGHADAIASAITAATDAGAKRCVELPVSAPFHCRLMSPAADAMSEALSSTNISAPSVPVVSNVRASAVESPEKIRSCLVEQVTGRVRWRESVEFMSSSGITNIVEVGSGKVLCGLVRRINRDITTSAVGSLADLDSYLGEG